MPANQDWGRILTELNAQIDAHNQKYQIPVVDRQGVLTGETYDTRSVNATDQPDPDKMRTHLAYMMGQDPNISLMAGRKVEGISNKAPAKSRGFLQTTNDIAKQAFNKSILGAIYEYDQEKQAFPMEGYDPSYLEGLASDVLGFMTPADIALLAAGGGVGGVAMKTAAKAGLKNLLKKETKDLVKKAAKDKFKDKTKKAFMSNFTIQKMEALAKGSGSLAFYNGTSKYLRSGGNLEEAMVEFGKGGVLGGSLTLTGMTVGTLAAMNKMGKITSGIAKVGTEVGTLGTMSPAMEGHLPSVEDYSHAAGMILGLKVAHAVTNPGKTLDRARMAIAGKIIEEFQKTGNYRQAVDNANSFIPKFINKKILDDWKKEESTQDAILTFIEANDRDKTRFKANDMMSWTNKQLRAAKRTVDSSTRSPEYKKFFNELYDMTIKAKKKISENTHKVVMLESGSPLEDKTTNKVSNGPYANQEIKQTTKESRENRIRKYENELKMIREDPETFREELPIDFYDIPDQSHGDKVYLDKYRKLIETALEKEKILAEQTKDNAKATILANKLKMINEDPEAFSRSLSEDELRRQGVISPSVHPSKETSKDEYRLYLDNYRKRIDAILKMANESVRFTGNYIDVAKVNLIKLRNIDFFRSDRGGFFKNSPSIHEGKYINCQYRNTAEKIIEKIASNVTSFEGDAINFLGPLNRINKAAHRQYMKQLKDQGIYYDKTEKLFYTFDKKVADKYTSDERATYQEAFIKGRKRPNNYDNGHYVMINGKKAWLIQQPEAGIAFWKKYYKGVIELSKDYLKNREKKIQISIDRLTALVTEGKGTTGRTKVVNKKNTNKYDVYIGRGSIWGNPYTHIKGKTQAKYIVDTREEAIAKYEEYLLNSPELMSKLHTLSGKTLGCYCAPLSCHGDILAKYADRIDSKKQIQAKSNTIKDLQNELAENRLLLDAYSGTMKEVAGKLERSPVPPSRIDKKAGGTEDIIHKQKISEKATEKEKEENEKTITLPFQRKITVTDSNGEKQVRKVGIFKTFKEMLDNPKKFTKSFKKSLNNIVAVINPKNRPKNVNPSTYRLVRMEELYRADVDKHPVMREIHDLETELLKLGPNKNVKGESEVSQFLISMAREAMRIRTNMDRSQSLTTAEIKYLKLRKKLEDLKKASFILRGDKEKGTKINEIKQELSKLVKEEFTNRIPTYLKEQSARPIYGQEEYGKNEYESDLTETGDYATVIGKGERGEYIREGDRFFKRNKRTKALTDIEIRYLIKKQLAEKEGGEAKKELERFAKQEFGGRPKHLDDPKIRFDEIDRAPFSVHDTVFPPIEIVEIMSDGSLKIKVARKLDTQIDKHIRLLKSERDKLKADPNFQGRYKKEVEYNTEIGRLTNRVKDLARDQNKAGDFIIVDENGKRIDDPSLKGKPASKFYLGQLKNIKESLTRIDRRNSYSKKKTIWDLTAEIKNSGKKAPDRYEDLPVETKKIVDEYIQNKSKPPDIIHRGILSRKSEGEKTKKSQRDQENDLLYGEDNAGYLMGEYIVKDKNGKSHSVFQLLHVGVPEKWNSKKGSKETEGLNLRTEIGQNQFVEALSYAYERKGNRPEPAIYITPAFAKSSLFRDILLQGVVEVVSVKNGNIKIGIPEYIRNPKLTTDYGKQPIIKLVSDFKTDTQVAVNRLERVVEKYYGFDRLAELRREFDEKNTIPVKEGMNREEATEYSETYNKEYAYWLMSEKLNVRVNEILLSKNNTELELLGAELKEDALDKASFMSNAGDAIAGIQEKAKGGKVSTSSADSYDAGHDSGPKAFHPSASGILDNAMSGMRKVFTKNKKERLLSVPMLAYRLANKLGITYDSNFFSDAGEIAGGEYRGRDGMLNSLMRVIANNAESYGNPNKATHEISHDLARYFLKLDDPELGSTSKGGVRLHKYLKYFEEELKQQQHDEIPLLTETMSYIDAMQEYFAMWGNNKLMGKDSPHKFPRLNARWEQMKEESPLFKEAVEEFQQGYLDLRELEVGDPINALKIYFNDFEKIKSPVKKSGKDKLTKLLTKVVNKDETLTRFLEMVFKVKGEVPPDRMRADRVKQAISTTPSGLTETFISGNPKLIDTNLELYEAKNRKGLPLKSIAQIVKELGSDDLVMKWMIVPYLRKTEAWHESNERGKGERAPQTGIPIVLARRALAEIKKDKDWGKISKALEEYEDIVSALHQMLADHKILPKKMVEKYQRFDPTYIPLKRILLPEYYNRMQTEEVKVTGLFAAKNLATKKSDVGGQIDHPLAQMQNMFFDMFSAVAKKTVKDTFYQNIKDYNPKMGDPGMGLYIERVSEKEMMAEGSYLVDLKNIKEALKERGVELEIGEFDQEVFLDLLGLQHETPEGKSILQHGFQDGKPVYWRLDNNLMDAFINYNDKYTINALGKVFNFPTKIIKNLAVTYNPFFFMRNLTRDIVTAQIYTKNDMKFRDIINGYKSAYVQVLGKGGRKDAQDLMDYGIVESTMIGARKYGSRGSWDEVSKVHQKDILSGVRKIGSKIKKLGLVSEMGPRIAEYNAALRSGKNISEALRDSREITIDFARSAYIGRAIGLAIPFFNPQLQGLDKMRRSLLEKDEAGFTRQAKLIVARTLLHVTLPTMIFWLLNKDEQWYKDLSPYDKAAWWHYKLPFSKDTIIKAPKPFDIGTIGGGIVETALNYAYGEDQVKTEQGVDAVVERVMPLGTLNPFKVITQTIGQTALFRPFLEWNFNRNLFYENDLVDYFTNQKPPELQYYDNTPNVYRFAGDMLGLSPLKIRQTVKSTTAGWGDVLAQGTDFFINPFLEEKRKAESIYSKVDQGEKMWNNIVSTIFPLVTSPKPKETIIKQRTYIIKKQLLQLKAKVDVGQISGKEYRKKKQELRKKLREIGKDYD